MEKIAIFRCLLSNGIQSHWVIAGDIPMMWIEYQGEISPTDLLQQYVRHHEAILNEFVSSRMGVVSNGSGRDFQLDNQTAALLSSRLKLIARLYLS